MREMEDRKRGRERENKVEEKITLAQNNNIKKSRTGKDGRMKRYDFFLLSEKGEFKKHNLKVMFPLKLVYRMVY